jgi:4a-hydroxytetrahydrobiopterin dehydratase
MAATSADRTRDAGPIGDPEAPERAEDEAEARTNREVDMSVLSDEQVSERLAGLEGWTRQGDTIVHLATLADFKAAVLYVGAVAYLAESANHHPDIAIAWNKVTLTLSTHSAGGLTGNDFALAEQINRLSAT